MVLEKEVKEEILWEKGDEKRIGVEKDRKGKGNNRKSGNRENGDKRERMGIREKKKGK